MASPIQKLVSKVNPISLIGKLDRDNTKWSGYEHASGLADRAGEAGIKIRTSPDKMSNTRPFTLGNTIFIPKGYADQKFWEQDEEGNYYQPTKDEIYQDIILEEMPHVAQWRE